MKFKLGDKVKVVKITDKAPYEDAIGKTATIGFYNKDTEMYFIHFDTGFTVPELMGSPERFDRNMVFFEEELELVNE